jgi:DNA primase
VVVEGPIDAVKGGPGFIASFGVNLTDEQMCTLLRFENVLFLQDSDEAGDKFKEQAYRLSSLGHGSVELGHLPNEFKDVGEMGIADIVYLRKELGFGAN